MPMDIEQAKKDLSGINFNHAKWREKLPKDVSRRKVAAVLETTDSNLISIEKGNSLPSILLAFRYCKLTDLPVDDLITIEANK